MLKNYDQATAFGTISSTQRRVAPTVNLSNEKDQCRQASEWVSTQSALLRLLLNSAFLPGPHEEAGRRPP